MTENKKLINIRVTAREKKKLESMAAYCGRSLSEYLCRVFEPRPALGDDFYDCYYRLCELCKRRFGKLGGNVAYHGYQSFAEGEVTPEEAHRIGMETAKRMWGEDYEVVVTTHLNTENIHNHFVVNSVSFRTGRKFENHISDYFRLRELSNAICAERSKSVLENASFYGGEKGAYWARRSGKLTHREILRRDVEHCFFQQELKISCRSVDNPVL